MVLNNILLWITPSKSQLKEIDENCIGDPKSISAAIGKSMIRVSIPFISEKQIPEIVEGVRMAFPDQCVFIDNGADSLQAHVSWNSQINCFLFLPVYTDAGKLAVKRRLGWASLQEENVEWI